MEDYIISKEGNLIKSFIRKKDGVEFKIGDNVTDFIYSEVYKIYDFNIFKNKLFVYVKKGSLHTLLYPSLIKIKHE